MSNQSLPQTQTTHNPIPLIPRPNKRILFIIPNPVFWLVYPFCELTDRLAGYHRGSSDER